MKKFLMLFACLLLTVIFRGEAQIRDKEIGIIIEIKYAENARFEEACQSALKQIEERNYIESLREDDFHTIYRYGIACYKKRCKVAMEKEWIQEECLGDMS